MPDFLDLTLDSFCPHPLVRAPTVRQVFFAGRARKPHTSRYVHTAHGWVLLVVYQDRSHSVHCLGSHESVVQAMMAAPSA